MVPERPSTDEAAWDSRYRSAAGAGGREWAAEPHGELRRVAEGVQWVHADVAAWRPDGEYDLITITYLQLPAPAIRSVLARASGWLASGGTLLVISHDVADRGWRRRGVRTTAHGDAVRHDGQGGGIHHHRPHPERLRRAPHEAPMPELAAACIASTTSGIPIPEAATSPRPAARSDWPGTG